MALLIMTIGVIGALLVAAAMGGVVAILLSSIYSVGPTQVDWFANVLVRNSPPNRR
jgi:hypothetical protein